MTGMISTLLYDTVILAMVLKPSMIFKSNIVAITV